MSTRSTLLVAAVLAGCVPATSRHHPERADAREGVPASPLAAGTYHLRVVPSIVPSPKVLEGAPPELETSIVVR